MKLNSEKILETGKLHDIRKEILKALGGAESEAKL